MVLEFSQNNTSVFNKVGKRHYPREVVTNTRYIIFWKNYSGHCIPNVSESAEFYRRCGM